MNRNIFAGIPVLAIALAAGIALTTTGCPSGTDPQASYDLGYAAGFLQDDWYWQGYYDGYDTTDFEPVYYQGDTIPYYDTLSYDAGYWDGIWVAYNDGYFVDYRYAFIIGFSEGYDNAYWPDYLDFLDTDQHTELLNGGWADGYNDGFSEGRVFGAADYEAAYDFDWEAALAEYEDGVDLYFEEVDVGTGTYGPVVLYEYGTSPFAAKTGGAPERVANHRPAIRGGATAKQDATDELYRPLTTEAQQTLEETPATSERNDRTLRLTTSWLTRVQDYLATGGSTAKRLRQNRVVD